MINEDQKEKIITIAKQHSGISAIYLFGSYISGHAGVKSDIDLGILFNEGVDGFNRINLETEISNILNKEIDLVDMNKCGPFLRHQIYKYGKLIYHDNTEFPFLFRAKSINEYLDSNYRSRLRRSQLKKIKTEKSLIILLS